MDWQVPGYDEIRELGRGAQGRVVLASERGGGPRAVRAIKYVSRAAGSLQEEAATMAGVADPHVARVYAFVPGPEESGDAAIVMEAVEGHSLREILAARVALEPAAALAVLKGSLLGLAAAHAAGIVHRDYKPANVIVRPDGLSKLIDFGVAVPDGATGRVGTPAYMAPEQWTGGPATFATDIYAATCVFFECVTGARPYQATALAELQQQHQSASPPIERLPVALRSLTLRGLAKFPAQRPADALTFVADLEKAARRSYGRNWEKDGRAALAGLAAGLGGAALVAGTGAGTTGTATAGTAFTGLGARPGPLGRIVTGKVALLTGVVGLVAVVAGGTAVYSATQEEPPRPARTVTPSPTPTPTPVQVVFVQENAPGEQVRIATVTGLPEPLGQKVNATLRARVDTLMRQSRTNLGGNGDLLRVRAALGLRSEGLVSIGYTFSIKPADAATGNWVKNFGTRFAVNVDLTTGEEITAGEIFPGASLAALSRRIMKLDQTAGSCFREAPLRLTVANVDEVLEPAFVKKGMRATLHLAESAPAGAYSQACRESEELVPYRMLLDLMDPRFRAKLGR